MIPTCTHYWDHFIARKTNYGKGFFATEGQRHYQRTERRAVFVQPESAMCRQEEQKIQTFQWQIRLELFPKDFIITLQESPSLIDQKISPNIGFSLFLPAEI